MYYHASTIKGITVLEPRISNNGIPLIYFSAKRENVLVYLSNAVEKYCKETNFLHEGNWHKWASYGFSEDGRQRIEEYYPDALYKTYKGVSGYIYSADEIVESGFLTQIPDAATSSVPVKVTGAEFIPDAYTAILEAEKRGLLTIRRFCDMTEKMLGQNRKMIIKEYADAAEHPEYRHFLRGNFPDYFPEENL